MEEPHIIPSCGAGFSAETSTEIADAQGQTLARSAYEITQAERAAMHPDQTDLEWGYYFGAWSH